MLRSGLFAAEPRSGKARPGAARIPQGTAGRAVEPAVGRMARPAPVAMSLAELNSTSATVGQWKVKVVSARKEEYEYSYAGKQRQGMKFECILVSFDPTCYCVGVWKMLQGNKQVVEQAAAKFKDGTAWTMSRVSLETQTKRQFISASHKMVVNLASTKMTAELQSLHAIASDVAPPSSVADILQLQSKQFFDISALLRSVTGEATVQTKYGTRQRATVCCVDGSKMPNEDKVAQLKFTMFQKPGENSLDMMTASVGKAMSFFQLSYQQGSSGEFEVVTSQNFQCRAAIGEKAASLTAEAAVLQSLQSESLGDVTKQWEGNSVAKDYVDISAMQTTCALLNTMLSPTQDIFDTETLWQINFAELVAPARGSDVWTHDKKRLWFPSVLRDFSGEVPVWIREKAALQLASTQDTKSFNHAVIDGELLFPMLSSVRVLRTVSRGSGAEEPGADGDTARVNLVVVEGMEQPWSHGPSKALNEIFPLLLLCPRSVDCVLPASLTMLQKSSHYGLTVAYDTSVTRPCTKAVVLIRSMTKSKLEALGEKGHRLVTDAVEDGLFEALPGGGAAEPAARKGKTPVQVIATCTVENLPDFTLTPPKTGDRSQMALVSVTGVLAQKGGAAEPAVTPGGAGEPAGAAEVTTAVLVERVQLLAPSDAARVRHVLKQLITVAGQVRGSTRPALPTWSQEESPAKVAKCRQLGRWPTGDSVPESQDVGATP